MPAASHLEPDFLAAALNVARIGICFVDDAGPFIEVNTAFCELTGFARDELIGRPWTVAAPAEAAANAALFLLRDGATAIQSEALYVRWKSGADTAFVGTSLQVADYPATAMRKRLLA